jgi:glutamine amidotransferase
VICIVDYGVGNLGSILNMFRRIGATAQISSTVEEIRSATKLILPGVGSFDSGMTSLANSGLRDALDAKVLGDRTPVLGLCLGMQLMGHCSEEGSQRGLGWLQAETRRFPERTKELGLRIPHMGWNTITAKSGSPLFPYFAEPPRFYFVHSYHVICADPEDVAATTHHGTEVTAAVTHGNVMGVQFHPEKSHSYGMRLLRAFAELPSS